MIDQRSYGPMPRRSVRLASRNSPSNVRSDSQSTPLASRPEVATSVRPIAKPAYTAAHFAALTAKKTPPQVAKQDAPVQSAPRPAAAKLEEQVPPQAKSLSEQAALLSQKKKRFSKVRKMQFAFIAAGVSVFVIGITVSVMSFRTNTDVVAQAQVLSKQTTNTNANSDDDDNPDETNIDSSALANYKVAPDAPRKISIAKLGVASRVLSLGVKDTSELKTPSNIYDTGWYNASAKPGQQGAMLIDGHVQGPTKPGVFYGLKKLVANDVIDVERGDGKVIKYKVVKTQIYDAANTDMTAAMTAVTPGKPGLNLITCTGKLDKKTSHYNERLIVFATLAE